MHLLSLTLDPARFPDRSQYPFSLPVLQSPHPLDLSSPVTIFVGENGSGKSTLLRAIADACRIHVWESAMVERQRVRHSPYERDLFQYLTLQYAGERPTGAFFGADAFAEFTRMVDNWAASDPGLLAYFGGSSLVAKSHGQSHLAWFQSQLKRPGLFMLDEPESALSPGHQVEFVKLLSAASAAGAQLIVATHSPIIMAAPGSRIYCFGDKGIVAIEYEQTEHYKVFRNFMLDRGKFLS
jgi:predicted ATPase